MRTFGFRELPKELNQFPFEKEEIISRQDKLPEGLFAGCLDDPSHPERDSLWAMAFYKDREWLFEGVRKHQPKSYAALMDGTDPIIILSVSSLPTSPGRKMIYTYMGVNDLTILLDLQCSVPSCQGIEGPMSDYPLVKRFAPGMGLALAEAWYGRFMGMDIPARLPGSPIHQRQLPANLFAQKDLPAAICQAITGVEGFSFRPHHYVDSELCPGLVELLQSKLPVLFDFRTEEEFEDETIPDPHAGQFFSLNVFINTRPFEGSPEGTDLICFQSSSDPKKIVLDDAGEPVLFRMKQDKWDTLYRIVDPIETIDCYVAHTLTNPDERFDFAPYCEEF